MASYGELTVQHLSGFAPCSSLAEFQPYPNRRHRSLHRYVPRNLEVVRPHAPCPMPLTREPRPGSRRQDTWRMRERLLETLKSTLSHK